jgi:hypothetical protein
MKNFKFLIPVAAFCAVSVLTSCSDESSSVAKKTVDVAANYELTLTSNVDAQFVVEGQAMQTGTTATFTDITDKSVKVTVTATDASYAIPTNSQTMTVNFSDKNASNVVDFTFAKVSANQVAQNDAKGNIVTNDAENASAFSTVSIMVPENVAITGNTTDPFSVTAYEPTEEVSEVVNGSETTADVALMAMQCTPHNGQFSPALTMKVYLDKEYAGMEVFVEDKMYVVDEDGYVSFETPHFSTWIIKGKVKYTQQETGVEVEGPTTYTFQKGPNKIDVDFKTGWEVISGSKMTSTIKKKISKIKTFGKYYRERTATVTYTASQSGTGTVTLKQAWTDYKVLYGSKNFVIRVWNNAALDVTDPAEHSGAEFK